MLNFLFGILCASGAVFGSYLAWRGVTVQDHEAVIAGGVFIFGSLLTFGVGQIHRLIRKQRKAGRHRARNSPLLRMEPARADSLFREEPEAFPTRADPVVPHPVLERVASRFARADR